jgi:hypothetical protein
MIPGVRDEHVSERIDGNAGGFQETLIPRRNEQRRFVPSNEAHPAAEFVDIGVRGAEEEARE